MVSKNEKSPDDSKESEINACTDEEKDVLAGKSHLLQVPVTKIPCEVNLNDPIDSPQTDKNVDMDSILQEASENEIAGNENKADGYAKIQSTENENTHLPDMKIKVENRKTKPVLETVQFESFSPETEAEKNSRTEVIPEPPLAAGESDSKNTVLPDENVASETKPAASIECHS